MTAEKNSQQQPDRRHLHHSHSPQQPRKQQQQKGPRTTEPVGPHYIVTISNAIIMGLHNHTGF